MQFRVAQVWILAIFMTSVVLELCLVGVSFIRGAIYADDLRDLTVRFLAIYSVPLGVVISGIFAKSASSKHRAASQSLLDRGIAGGSLECADTRPDDALRLLGRRPGYQPGGVCDRYCRRQFVPHCGESDLFFHRRKGRIAAVQDGTVSS
jgi:hypothetical protein